MRTTRSYKQGLHQVDHGVATFFVTTFALALVLTIGFGLSAASNGQGFSALHLGSKAATTGDQTGQSSDKKGDSNDNNSQKGDKKTFTATTFEFDPGHTGTVAAAWVKHLGLPQTQRVRFLTGGSYPGADAIPPPRLSCRSA